MSLEKLPLFFGFDRINPIGRISILDENVQETFVRDLELMRKGKILDVPRYLVSFEGRIVDDGDITIVSFAFIQEPHSMGSLLKKDKL